MIYLDYNATTPIDPAVAESGRRAGTENVLLAAALGKACELAIAKTDDTSIKVRTSHFFSLLKAAFGSMITLNGHPEARLPNTLNISFSGWQGQALLDRLEGVAASTGSACHAGMTEISPVLSAMGMDEAAGRGAIRFSLGRLTTDDDIRSVVHQLQIVISQTG